MAFTIINSQLIPYNDAKLQYLQDKSSIDWHNICPIISKTINKDRCNKLVISSTFTDWEQLECYDKVSGEINAKKFVKNAPVQTVFYFITYLDWKSKYYQVGYFVLYYINKGKLDTRNYKEQIWKYYVENKYTDAFTFTYKEIPGIQLWLNLANMEEFFRINRKLKYNLAILECSKVNDSQLKRIIEAHKK